MLTRFSKIALIFYASILWLSFPSCAPSMAIDDWEDVLPHSGQSLFDMINRQEIVEMTLVTELDSIIQNRYTDDYRAATFSYEDVTGNEHFYQAKVKPRGKFRRKVCEFPPLKLKFSKKELEAAGLSDLNEVKLVTHCLDDKAISKEMVLREYLIYKMYNELTPNSLRVQLVKVTYRDSKDPGYKIKRWGFLLEDDEEFADRVGGSLCDCMGKLPEDFHPSQEKIVALFQYMVGNTDWDLKMNRNVKLVKIGDGKLIPVPYDFDFSAVVGAPYARPNNDVGQKSMSERVFMGYAENWEDMYATFSYFRSKKDRLYSIVNNFRQLDSGSRDAIIEYLNSFYMTIENEQALQQMFAKNN